MFTVLNLYLQKKKNIKISYKFMKARGIFMNLILFLEISSSTLFVRIVNSKENLDFFSV